MGRSSARSQNFDRKWCPAIPSALLTYLMLNGGSLPGMEILPNPALFGLLRHFEQCTGFFFRVPRIENGAPCYQQIRPRLDHRGNRIVGHASIDLDPEIEPKFRPQVDQPPDLIQRERNELLTPKPRVNTHHKHVMD